MIVFFPILFGGSGFDIYCDFSKKERVLGYVFLMVICSTFGLLLWIFLLNDISPNSNIYLPSILLLSALFSFLIFSFLGIIKIFVFSKSKIFKYILLTFVIIGWLLIFPCTILSVIIQNL